MVGLLGPDDWQAFRLVAMVLVHGSPICSESPVRQHLEVVIGGEVFKEVALLHCVRFRHHHQPGCSCLASPPRRCSLRAPPRAKLRKKSSFWREMARQEVEAT